MSDYRCTPYCAPFVEIEKKKVALLTEIRRRHPRARNIYKIVRSRGTEDHKAFFKMYNDKCCYCGCSVTVLSVQSFEVDHIKPQAAFPERSADVNALPNLSLACRKCNGGKLAFWSKEMNGEWNPDNGGITRLFYRDNFYNILINEGFDLNPVVLELYDKLKLKEQIRRLDYLLMSLDGYINSLSQESKKRDQLSSICYELIKKRNHVGI